MIYVMTLILTPFYPIYAATTIGISALWHESAEKKPTRREAGNDVPQG
ncbi:hypothetical protein P4H65_05520 [Paenibacillus chitinolyticus]|nr:hypothetical protein [Paenibacillus chitinolyticus]MEC0245252.1 hypothetical protein [Paenibacillus chitinolyticus]